ncbi:MAG: DUF488 domain-containing protein [Ardenticatenaceae bacterium]|nr:DUF488 domain-containing protein [Ardenticatenaceae bacterium]HBY98953.1 hypothetical protein [Chloroflexota bacterium]
MSIELKRAYAPPDPGDGARFLVDRIWPRGVKKEDLALDGWLKEVAPGNELRRWFGHDPEKWEEFRKRYRRELDALDPAVFGPLLDAARTGTLTLIYGAKDEAHNNAVVLRDYLQARL